MVAQLSRALFVGALLAIAISSASSARAQSHPSFEEAMKLMRDGMFAQACPKLEEALAAEKTMIIRFRLAECYEQTGKLASALNAYREVAGEAALKNLSDREAFAKKKAAELLPRVSKLKLLVPPEVGAIAELEILVNGVVLERSSWAAETPLDLGTHSIVVNGPGYRTWLFEFELKGEREIRTIQVPNQIEAVAPTPTPTNTPTPTPETPDDGGGLSTQAIAGISVGAAGVVLTIVGIAVGVAAKGDYDDSLVGCNAQNQCTQQALDAQESAVVSGNVATALFVIGLAATAGGVVMWILAPSDDDIALGITPGGVALRAHF
jgi:hypothetical protein